MRPVISAALLLASALAAGPIYAQEFSKWEGKEIVREGEGGTKKVIGDVEFWADGTPAKKFVLLGYIDDRRHKTGLVGKVRMGSLEKDVAKIAKENGGDAVLLLASDAETVGYVGSSNATTQANAYSSGNRAYGTAYTSGSVTSAAVQKQVSRFAVIKFVEDSPVSETSVPETSAPNAK
jgi:hypothetical protein